MANTESDLGVRDPHIIRSKDGDKYWILGTDLHAEGGGSGGSGWNSHASSKKLLVWESDDMVNWKKSVVDAGLDTAGCVWAPEAYYDEANNDYVVYWSARDEKYHGTAEGDSLKVYITRTKDFHNFTEPKVWLNEDGGSDNYNIIDSTIQKMGNAYYRFSTSDWNTVVDKSSTLSEDTYDVTKDNKNNSWQRVMSRGTNVQHGLTNKEGLNSYKLPNGDWCVVGDNGGYHGYIFDTENVQFKRISNMTFHDGTFRHGTILRVSKAEKEALLKKYDPNNKYQPVAKAEPTLVEASVTVNGGTASKAKANTGDVVTLTANNEEGKEFTGWSFNKTPTFADKTSADSKVAKIYMTTEAVTATANYKNQEVEEEQQDPVLSYDFEDGAMKDTTGKGNDGTLEGNAKVQKDNDKDSNVLYLDGTSNTFAQLPDGFFDGRDKMTISMDIKNEMSSGNFFTFTLGQDTNKYAFLRTRGNEVRNAITTSSYKNEKEVKASKGAVGQWMNVKIVYNDTSMKLYLNGRLASENKDTGLKISDLGSSLKSYLGKSFYPDAYFKGAFDNVKVYNRALSEQEVADEAGVEIPTVKAAATGSDQYVFASSKVDEEKNTVNIQISKSNSRSKDYTKVPVKFTLKEGATLNSGEDNVLTLDLTKEQTIKTTYNNKEQIWTVKAEVANNSVLGGQFADPDIDVLDGKFWIYPTTDGFSGWSGTQFHAFSSEDMVNWKDEGIIVDVKANTDAEAGKNENGVQIASVPWATGSAWAPTIEERNGKYYYYFCAKKAGGESAIGVAVADDPAGPFKAADEPLMTKAISAGGGASIGQAIDPSIFTDDDGTVYMTYGNGGAAIVELNEDMMSIKKDTIRKINGMTDFRESVVINKRNGIYHFTWSCDDTGSENYRVNYGTTTSLDGDSINVSYKGNVLYKVPGEDILGTGHHSIVNVPGTDDWYIAYHRFVTPLGQYTSGLGYHRETCIDKVTFDKETGLMNKITPTMKGISEAVTIPKAELTLSYKASTGGKIQGETTQTVKRGENGSKVTAVAEEGYTFKKWSDGVTTAEREDKAVTEDKTLTAYFEKVETPVPPVVVTKPATVTGLKSYSNKTTSVKLSWKKVSGAKGYEVYRYSTKYKKYVKIKTTSATNCYNSGLKAGNTYYYKVRAYKDASGKVLYGDFSKTLKTATAPSKVTKVKAKKASKSKIKLSWKKVKGASGYAVYMKTGNGKYKRVKTITKGSTVKYTKAKLKKGKKYTFKIRAYKKADKNIYGSYSTGKSYKLR